MIRFALYYFVYFVNFSIIAPYFQTFLYNRGFNESEVGLLLGTFALAGAAGAIGVGHLADRLGKRRPLLAAAMIVSISLMIPLIWIDQVWLALPVVALFGIAYKATIPLADTLAASSLPDPTHQYGRARAMGSIGFIAGCWGFFLFGLVDEASATSILAGFVGSAVLAVPVILLLPDPHRRVELHPGGTASSGGFDRVFWLFLTIIFLGQLGMSAYYSFFTLYLSEFIGIQAPARIWTIGAAAEIPFIFFAGWVIRRFGVVRMLAGSLTAMAVRLCLYGALPHLAAIIPVTLLHAFTFGLMHTATIEFIRRKVRPANQGLAMTLYMSVGLGAAQMVGSVLGGQLITHAGYRAMFVTLAAAPLIGLILLIFGHRRLGMYQPGPEDGLHRLPAGG